MAHNSMLVLSEHGTSYTTIIQRAQRKIYSYNQNPEKDLTNNQISIMLRDNQSHKYEVNDYISRYPIS